MLNFFIVDAGIRFFSEEINFTLKSKGRIRLWLANVIRTEKQQLPDLNYIFCPDQYLAELNKQFLKHNTYTDILTFPRPSDTGRIAGDIYISIDRVNENAVKFNQPFEKELARVMVHGVLHLLGYKDKNKQEKEIMSGKEDFYLNTLSRF